MAKLVIVLCVVFYTSVANALFLPWSDLKVKDDADRAINNAIIDVEDRYEIAQKEIKEMLNKLRNEQENILKNFTDNLTNVLQKNVINQLIDEANGVDINECTALNDQLDYTAQFVIAKTSACLDDQLNNGFDRAESIIKRYNDVYANLTKITSETYDCVNNKKSTFRVITINAIVCSHTAIAKAASATGTAIPSIVVETAEFKVWIETLIPSLGLCKITNGLAAVFVELPIIVDKTKECIKRKIAEALVPSKILSRGTAIELFDNKAQPIERLLTIVE